MSAIAKDLDTNIELVLGHGGFTQSIGTVALTPRRIAYAQRHIEKRGVPIIYKFRF